MNSFSGLTLKTAERKCKRFSEFNVSAADLIEALKDFSPLLVLNSNSEVQLQPDKYSSYDLIAAVGKISELNHSDNIFEELKVFQKENNDWVFGGLSYNIKNQLENLNSSARERTEFPESYFFIPQYVITYKNKELIIYYSEKHDDENSVNDLINKVKNRPSPASFNPVEMKWRLTKEEYIKRINKIKDHIQQGDIYEMNFCSEFYENDATIDPTATYRKLNDISPMPFSAYFRKDHLHLMCASPERFIARRDSKIISQPIKGTARRMSDAQQDDIQKNKLRNDPKELSENVMIVDLVRNDLSKTAAKGSVHVEELFGVKSFSGLHHLISTVTSEIKKGLDFTDVLKHAFPMGSMTGAPKVRAMQIIEAYEEINRGWYSGTLGYISPGGDADFNVIIRTLIYNSANKYLSYMAGSAITNASVAESEYEECMLKAEAIKKIFRDQRS